MNPSWVPGYPVFEQMAGSPGLSGQQLTRIPFLDELGEHQQLTRRRRHLTGVLGRTRDTPAAAVMKMNT